MEGSKVQRGAQFHQGGGEGLAEAVAWQELVLETLYLLVGNLLQPYSSLHHEYILRVLNSARHHHQLGCTVQTHEPVGTFHFKT